MKRAAGLVSEWWRSSACAVAVCPDHQLEGAGWWPSYRLDSFHVERAEPALDPRGSRNAVRRRSLPVVVAFPAASPRRITYGPPRPATVSSSRDLAVIAAMAVARGSARGSFSTTHATGPQASACTLRRWSTMEQRQLLEPASGSTPPPPLPQLALCPGMTNAPGTRHYISWSAGAGQQPSSACGRRCRRPEMHAPARLRCRESHEPNRGPRFPTSAANGSPTQPEERRSGALAAASRGACG